MSGVCQVPGTAADTVTDSAFNMVVTRFVVTRYGELGFRLAAQASFQPRMPVEPDVTGMTIELDDASGVALFSASVPADMFEANYARTRFLYVPDAPPTMPLGGLISLTVTTGGPSVVVTAKAIVPTEALPTMALAGGPVERASAASKFSWTIRWGGRCVTNPVHCRPRKKCPPQ